MKRYVDATKLSETFHAWENSARLCGDSDFETAYNLCASEVDNAETEDAIPLNHAHWIPKGAVCECSNCGALTSAHTLESHVWCHICGYRMDEEDVVKHYPPYLDHPVD